MRKFFLWVSILAAVAASQSCLDNNDNTPNYKYFVTKIDSVSMAETANFKEEVKITVYSTVKESCEAFFRFNTGQTGDEYTISTIAIKYDEKECGEKKKIDPELKFNPREPGDYKFRFWAGKDETTKKDVFITKTIHIKSPTE